MKYLRSFLYLLLLSLVPLTADAQWEKIYKQPPYDDEGQDVVQLPDGGFLIAGYTETSNAFDMDVQLIRTDGSGNIVSQQKWGGNKPDFINRILPASDGSYYLIGYTQSFGGGDMDILLMNVSAAAAINWTMEIGGNGNEMGMEIIPTADGKYLIAGSKKDIGKSDWDAYLMKIEPNGSKIWEYTYGSGTNDYANSVKEAKDGGFVVLGTSLNSGKGDAYLFKVDASGSAGTPAWQEYYGGPEYDEGIHLQIDANDSLAFLVRDTSITGNDIDIHAYKAGPDGKQMKKQVFGGDKKDTPKSIMRTADGGYIIAGISRSWGLFNPDAWLIKTDAQLNAMWIRNFGGAGNEHCYVARELSDGSFIAVGKTHSYAPDMDVYLLKLNSWGTLEVGLRENMISGDINIFPNPATQILNIRLEGQEKHTLKIHNILGQEVYSTDNFIGGALNTAELGLTAGMYDVQLEKEGKFYNKKCIIAN